MTLLYFLFVHVILLVPGFALVRKSGFFKGKPALELCAAYAVSIIVMAGMSIGGYVFAAPHYWLHTLAWLLIAFGFYSFYRQRLYRKLTQYRFPLLVLVAMSLFSCMFIGLHFSGTRVMIPDPQPVAHNNYEAFSVKVLNVAHTVANDNYVPYRQAQFILNRSDPAKDSFIDEWGVHFFQRTPLLGGVTAQFFTLLGDVPPVGYTWGVGQTDPRSTYAKFQIIGQIMNSLFVLPAFYLLTRLFNRRTAQTTLLFIIPSAYFLFNSFFTWPKSLVAFFIVFSWLLLYEKRLRFVLAAGVASGVAYLAHDLAVLYIGSSVLLLLHWRRLKDIAFFAGTNILLAIPWLATSALLYHKPSTFIYYPFSLHDIPQVSQRHAIMKEFFDTSPLRIIAIKLESLLYLFSPYQLLFSEGGQKLANRLWAGTLFNLPGAAGFGLMIPFFLGLVKQIRNLPFLIMALVPVVLCTLIIGWPKGMGALHFAEASVVLWMGLGVWFLFTLKNRLWLWAAFIVSVAQFIFFALFSYNFRVDGWLNLQDIVQISGMLIIIAGCGFGFYIISSDNKKGAWQALSARLSRLRK